jgi:hypothetical protein
MSHFLDYYTSDPVYVNGRPWNGFDLPEDDCLGTKPKYFFDELSYKEENMFASTYVKTKPIEPKISVQHTSSDGMQFVVMKRHKDNSNLDYIVAMFEWQDHAQQFLRSFQVTEALIFYTMERIVP